MKDGIFHFRIGQIGKRLVVGAAIYSSFLISIYAQQSKKTKTRNLNNLNYISAFDSTPYFTSSTKTCENKDSMLYTIQICTLNYAINDRFFLGNYKIKIIRMGELYRYIFSQYNSLEKARHALIHVQQIYPSAFIREYKNGKLGLAIDINIDHIRINN